MAFAQRKALMGRVESLRPGRRLICFCNFDRQSSQGCQGLTTHMAEDAKEPLYRTLKEAGIGGGTGLDLLLYTRGGDTNSVWPLVSLIREFDPDFEVLVPFRCHSAGTMLALAAKRIHMTRIGELSPIDPTVGNAFNPPDPTDPKRRALISVEDVKAFEEFVAETLTGEQVIPKEARSAALSPFLHVLVQQVHPLALGNVRRLTKLSELLAGMLLEFRWPDEAERNEIVTTLIRKYGSHSHMISRAEAAAILGEEHVAFASRELDAALDALLRRYEDDFHLREPFLAADHIGDDLEKPCRFIGAVIECRTWGYVYETEAAMRQYSVSPEGVPIQMPPGSAPGLVPGFKRGYDVQVRTMRWARNKRPRGHQ